MQISLARSGPGGNERRSKGEQTRDVELESREWPLEQKLKLRFASEVALPWHATKAVVNANRIRQLQVCANYILAVKLI